MPHASVSGPETAVPVVTSSAGSQGYGRVRGRAPLVYLGAGKGRANRFCPGHKPELDRQQSYPSCVVMAPHQVLIRGGAMRSGRLVRCLAAILFAIALAS